MKLARRLLVATALLCPAGPLLALSSDRDQPVAIRARHVEANEKTGVAVYQGRVTLDQGSLHIEADRVEVRRRDGQIESLLATGNPLRARTRPDNQDEDINMSAQRLAYHQPTHYLVLTGDPVFTQGDKRLTARCLEYDDLFEQADLYGDVTADRGEDRVHAAYLHYDVPEDRLLAGPAPDATTRPRVSAVILPRKKGSAGEAPRP
jgi:lipopolysaccharide export system protein LptA